MRSCGLSSKSHINVSYTSPAGSAGFTTSVSHPSHTSHLKLTSTSRIPLHLRPVLRKVRDFKAALRMAAEEQLRRRRADREMEEAGLREAVLSTLRAD